MEGIYLKKKTINNNNETKWMCFIRSNNSSLISMYYHKRNKKLNKTKVFNQTFLTVDESKNLTILK
jgi:hypothetical protein